jgi:hypothetical protein
MTLANLLSGAVGILPWLFVVLGAAVVVVVGVKVGMPAARILLLQEEIKLLRLQLKAAQTHAKACDERNDELNMRFEVLAAENKTLAIRASQLLSVIELKTGAPTKDVLSGMSLAQ